MRIPFTKMNGAGNDFVMSDNRELNFDLSGGDIRIVCDRKRGIGADGVILIEPEDNADFRMRYYNADGTEAEMCGNGARCAALFASTLGLGEAADDVTVVSFAAQPGLMEASVRGDRISVAMTEAIGFERDVILDTTAGKETVHLVNTGVPHAIAIVEEWDSITDEAVCERGRLIRQHKKFLPAGINANFVHCRKDGIVEIRTYERGVESETLACGTGSVAAAVVAGHLGLAESPVRLFTRGGEMLEVAFSMSPTGASGVTLEGPAAVNFEGFVDLPQKG